MKMRQAAVCACTAKFLSLLPQIQEQARFAFRREGGEQREELIAEVVANCWAAFVRLVDRGLIDVAQATPLAQFAIKQIRDGRRVGAKLCVHDVSSGYAQRMKHFRVERLDHFDERRGDLARSAPRGPPRRPFGNGRGPHRYRGLVRHAPQAQTPRRGDSGQERNDEDRRAEVRGQPGSHLADPTRTGNVVAGVPGRLVAP